jgi:uncharacterized LabA/DUF88 family protein
MRITPGPGAKSRERLHAFVDGAYVRSELRSIGCSDEFDPNALARGLVGSFELVRVNYYDALDEQPSTSEQQAECSRLNQYFEWVSGRTDTHVVLGRVRHSRPREQKGVDVHLAVDALRTAYSGTFDAILLVSGDADFEPLVTAIRESGPRIHVAGFETSTSVDLKRAADRFLPLEPSGGGSFNFRSK